MKIIDTIPIYSPDTWVLITIGAIFLTAFIVGTLWVHDSNWSTPSVITNGVIIAAGIVLFILMCSGKFHHFSYDKYVLECDDTVTINEICEKYKIVEKEKYSNIYYVVDKE